jgi:hypothetical protein
MARNLSHHHAAMYIPIQNSLGRCTACTSPACAKVPYSTRRCMHDSALRTRPMSSPAAAAGRGAGRPLGPSAPAQLTGSGLLMQINPAKYFYIIKSPKASDLLPGIDFLTRWETNYFPTTIHALWPSGIHLGNLISCGHRSHFLRPKCIVACCCSCPGTSLRNLKHRVDP